MDYILGIDIGTSNVKAVLYNTTGDLIAKSNKAYPTMHPNPGWAEQNPEDWFNSVASAIRELLISTTVSPREIISLGITGHIRTIAFLDQDFNALYPGIVWSDTRSRHTADFINSEMEEYLLKETGNRAATNFSLSQIVWVKENFPNVIKKTKFFVTPKDYVIYRLTGKFVSDPSTQSGSLLINIDEKDWSDELLLRFGISRDNLPVILQSTEVVGYVTSDAAENCGLVAGLPVVMGGGDNDCAAIGSGAYTIGTLSISLGTAGIILTQLENPIKSIAGRLDIFAHVIPGSWYAMGMVTSAGFALDWLKKRLNGEAESLTISEEIIPFDDWLTSSGVELNCFLPGSNGLLCFPYYQGKGNPDKNPDATGVFWGLTGSHSNKHMIQASMEGVGYCIRQCVDTISEISTINEIVCSGKGSTNTLWMKIISNILGKPIWTRWGVEVGSLGAAILAATGSGVYGTVLQACEIMTKRDKQYIPQDDIVLAYKNYYDNFCSISDILWRKN